MALLFLALFQSGRPAKRLSSCVPAPAAADQMSILMRLPCSLAAPGHSLTRFKRAVAGQTKVLRPLFFDLTRKTMEQRCKFCLLWLRAHQTDPEDMESMGAMSETCSQIALQCFSSARIGRPYLRWARTIWHIQSQEAAQFPKVCADPVSMMIGRSKDWHCAITNLYRFSNELVWHRHSLLRSQKKSILLPLRTTVSSVRTAPLKTRREPLGLSKSGQTSHSET